MLQVVEYGGSRGHWWEIELEVVDVKVCVVGGFHGLNIGNADGDTVGGDLLVIARAVVADAMA